MVNGDKIDPSVPVAQSGVSETTLALSIRRGPGSETERMTWQDNDEGKLETRMAEIAVEVILTAEIQYREMAVQHYQLPRSEAKEKTYPQADRAERPSGGR